MENQTVKSKDDILDLLDQIKNQETKDVLLKLFTSIFLGATEKTQEYFTKLKTEFMSDPPTKALLIALAYVFQMNKVYKKKEVSKDGKSKEQTVQDSKS